MTMKTDSRELLDAVTVWALDFDPELACEVTLENGEVCGDHAEWIVWCIVCGYSALECDPCLKVISGADVNQYFCPKCHTVRRKMFELYRVEGIR